MTTYALSVENASGISLKGINIPDQKTYEEIKNNCCFDRTNMADACQAVFMPIRTSNCCDFIKDFFLPTVVNGAFKVNHVVFRIFAVLLCLPLDLLTFPLRVLTVIPRCYGNQFEKTREHPLRAYLESKTKIDLDDGPIKIEITKSTQKANGDTETWTQVFEMDLPPYSQESIPMFSYGHTLKYHLHKVGGVDERSEKYSVVTNFGC